MNFMIYAPIAIVLTVFFVLSYLKQKKLYLLSFAIWVPSTMLQYVSNNRVFFNVLCVVEFILFAVTMVLLVKDALDNRKKKQEETDEEDCGA